MTSLAIAPVRRAADSRPSLTDLRRVYSWSFEKIFATRQL